MILPKGESLDYSRFSGVYSKLKYVCRISVVFELHLRIFSYKKTLFCRRLPLSLSLSVTKIFILIRLRLLLKRLAVVTGESMHQNGVNETHQRIVQVQVLEVFPGFGASSAKTSPKAFCCYFFVYLYACKLPNPLFWL